MKHLTQSSLLARGWSKSLIAALLKDPDKEAVNPNHRRGPPMKLWCEERVTAMEQHCDFVAYQDKRKKRSAAALNAADRKRQELLRAVRDWDARIEVRPMEEVRKAAVSHYDALHARRGHRKKHVTSDAPQHFLDRITCNFIRHELTDYEPLLAALKRKIGRPEAIELVRQK